MNEEQEPVAFVKGCNKGQWEIFPAKAYQIFEREQPLYTTPPQRKPLTDEEFRAILRSLSRQQGWDGDGWDLALKEAIEAAHGITKENT